MGGEWQEGHEHQAMHGREVLAIASKCSVSQSVRSCGCVIRSGTLFACVHRILFLSRNHTAGALGPSYETTAVLFELSNAAAELIAQRK